MAVVDVPDAGERPLAGRGGEHLGAHRAHPRRQVRQQHRRRRVERHHHPRRQHVAAVGHHPHALAGGLQGVDRRAGAHREAAARRQAAAQAHRVEAAVPRLEHGAAEPPAAARRAHRRGVAPLAVEALGAQLLAARRQRLLLAPAVVAVGQRRQPAPLGQEVGVHPAAVEQLAAHQLAVLARQVPQRQRPLAAHRGGQLAERLGRAGEQEAGVAPGGAAGQAGGLEQQHPMAGRRQPHQPPRRRQADDAAADDHRVDLGGGAATRLPERARAAVGSRQHDRRLSQPARCRR